MKLDKDIIGKYALHCNGTGPVMRIVGHDVDNNLNLRYKCEWKENCLQFTSLFRLSELNIFSEMPAEVKPAKVKVNKEQGTANQKEDSVHLDHLGNKIDPFTEDEIDSIFDGFN